MSGADTALGTVLGAGVVAAGAGTARALIGRADPFVENQSPFDRQSRLRLPASSERVTRELYLGYLKTQVRPWSEAETGALQKIVEAVGQAFEGLKLSLPSTVYLVKTTGEEEGHAAYTRGQATICLPASKVATLWQGAGGDSLHPEPSVGALRDIVIHEFFHLISKNNPKARTALYGLVHYVETGAPVALPDVPWPGPESPARLPELKITNPDTPVLDVYIEMALPGRGPEPLMPVLVAREPYEGGIFFEYLDWWFLAVEKQGRQWQVRLGEDGRPVAARAGDLMDQYVALVGRNITEEMFHPDEILAQSFVLCIKEPDLGRLQAIRDRIGP